MPTPALTIRFFIILRIILTAIYITNDLLTNDIMPFDDLQHGEYAAAHGGFTSIDYGFGITNRRVEIIR